MHALSQSAFLQALGYAIANSLWQVALLWIAVVLLNSIFRFSSAARYKVALYAQFAGFAWFLITLQFYFEKCSEAIVQTQALNGFKDMDAVSSKLNSTYSSLINGMIKTEQLLPYLSFAYLCLLIFLLTKLVVNFRSAQFIKTEKLHKTDVQWKLFVRKISSLLNIKSEVKIYLSELVKSPLTIGFLKPVILIPFASMNNLTTEQMEAVILHELAHIKRADYLINLFQCVIETGLFFNPFTQLLSRIIKKERENSCDDWVLQFQYQPEMYAEALLRIAVFQSQPSFAMHAAKNKGDLLSRVKRMIDKNQKTFNYRQQIVALLLMTCILSSFALLQPATKQNEAFANSKNTKAMLAPPAIAQVDNPLFSPTFFLSKPIKAEWNKAVDDAEESADDGLAKANEAIANIDFSKVISPAFDAVKNIDFTQNESDLKNVAIPQALNELKRMRFENMLNGDEDSMQACIVSDQMPDTMELMNAVQNAFQQVKNIDFKKLAQQSLQLAQEQMVKMQKQKLTMKLDEKKTKDAVTQAFEMIRKMSIQRDQAPASSGDEKLNDKIQRDKYQELLNRFQQKIDSINAAKAANSDASVNWKMSYPTYVETSDNEDDGTKNYSYALSSDDVQDSTIIVHVNDQVLPKADRVKVHPKENIHIIKSENGNTINLTIEIL